MIGQAIVGIAGDKSLTTAFAFDGRIGLSKIDKSKRAQDENAVGFTIVPIFDWKNKGIALVSEI